jgi:ABC-type branched-subunit amino acid transport system substrate-binding protein
MAAAALAFCAMPGSAFSQEEFKIGVVASLTGGFAGPSKDSMDGVQAWIDRHGLEGKKIVLEVLDDETNPVGASNAFRRVASDPDVKLVYAIVN